MKRFLINNNITFFCIGGRGANFHQEVLRSVRPITRIAGKPSDGDGCKSWKPNWTTTCLILPLLIPICMKQRGNGIYQ